MAIISCFWDKLVPVGQWLHVIKQALINIKFCCMCNTGTIEHAITYDYLQSDRLMKFFTRQFDKLTMFKPLPHNPGF